MENSDTLKDDIEDYLDTKVNIIKLQVIDKTGSAASSAIVGVAVLILGLFILQFLSFSAAYAISEYSGVYYLGFLLVAAFYILVAALLILLKERLVTMPLINSLLKKYYHPGSDPNVTPR